EAADPGLYNHILDAAAESITPAKLINNVWIRNVNEGDMDTLLKFLNSNVQTNILSVIGSTSGFELKKYLRLKFRVVQAAGCLVRKEETYLMIYRPKKCELAKGRREKTDYNNETSVREVEEETNSSVKRVKKTCTTWHTYTMNK